MNDDALDALYQDILLDHYRNPRHSGTIDNAACAHEQHNPLCGDVVEVQFALNDEGTAIASLAFHGKGCSISQASSSILCQCIEGQSLDYCHELLNAVEDMILHKAELPEELPEDLRALQGIQRFPARYKCALLPWQCLAHCLDSFSSK